LAQKAEELEESHKLLKKRTIEVNEMAETVTKLRREAASEKLRRVVQLIACKAIEADHLNARDQIKELEAAKKALVHENQNLQSSSESNQQIFGLIEQKDTLISQLQELIVALEQSNQALQDSLRSSQAALTESENSLELLTRDVEQLKIENKNLTKNNAYLTDEIECNSQLIQQISDKEVFLKG